MTLDARQQKAFDFCADSTKQLLTLSTAIVAFMVTFAKDFAPAVPPDSRWIAYAAWLFFFLSICCGVAVLLALTAQLEPKPGTAIDKPSIWEPAATYSQGQIGFFAIAMVMTIAFGVVAAWPRDQAVAKPAPATSEQVERLSAQVAAIEVALEAHAHSASKELTTVQASLKMIHAELARLRARGSCVPHCQPSNCPSSANPACPCSCAAPTASTR